MLMRRFAFLASALLSCAASPVPEPIATPVETPPAHRAPRKSTFRLEVDDADGDPEFEPALEAVADLNGATDTIRFGWRAPCRVPARNFKNRSDKGSGTTRMMVAFEKRDDGYEVRLEDFAFETLNGHSADSPEIREQTAPILAIAAAAMPSFLVSADGEYMGTVGIDEMLDALMEYLGDEVPPQVAEMMRQPEMQIQLQAAAGDYWNTWVGRWTGFALRPGEKQVRQEAIVFFGREFVVDVVVEHLGVVPGDSKLRLLRARSVLEGDVLTEAVREQVASMAGQVDRSISTDVIRDVRREIDLYVAIEPDTGRPHRVRSRSATKVSRKQRVEIQEWEFDWANAEGCH